MIFTVEEMTDTGWRYPQYFVSRWGSNKVAKRIALLGRKSRVLKDGKLESLFVPDERAEAPHCEGCGKSSGTMTAFQGRLLCGSCHEKDLARQEVE